MRCLVTGASGFIGSALVRELLSRGHSVTVLLRRHSVEQGSSPWRLRDSLPSIKVVVADLEELAGRKTELRLNALDVVFHLAWFGVTAEYRDSPEQILTNTVGSLRLWSMARDAGCKTWIGLGSQAEYGPQSAVLHEDMCPQPTTAYGVAKLATGLMTAKMSQLAGMRHVWFRLLSAYGPADDEAHMIPSVIASLLAGRRPAVTAGDQLWDFVYIDDVVSALCAALEEEIGGVYNLASGNTSRIRSVVEKIRDAIDPSLPVGFGEVPYQTGQVMHLAADIGKLKAATGWRPKLSLDQGLKQTVDWYRDALQVQIGDTAPLYSAGRK